MSIRILLLYLGFFCFLPLQAQNQELKPTNAPNKVFFKENDRHSFSISPNGKYFAQVIDKGMRDEVVIVDIDKYEVFQQFTLLKSIQSLLWLNDDRLLYEANGGIYAIDVDGENGIEIVGTWVDNPRATVNYYKDRRINNLLSLLPEKPNFILIETYNHKLIASVEEVNIYTGAKTEVINGKKPDMNKWIIDAERVPRIGLQFTDEQINFLEKNENSQEWEEFTVNIDNKQHSLSIEATTFLDQKVVFEGFGSEKDIIYLTTNVNSDKRKLLSYDLSKKMVLETLVADPNCDVTDVHGESLRFIYDYSKGSLAGIRYQGIVPQFKWFDPAIQKKHQTINEQYPGFINDILDMDDRGERFLILQWSDNNAGNIGIFDFNDNSYAVMFHFNDELNKYDLSKTKSIVAKARDGFNIPTYFNIPVNQQPDESMPLVVIPHGGPWARDYWELDLFSQYFAMKGYATLRVNFRGSTGFGRDHLLAGVDGLDGVMIDDIIDATIFVSDIYNIDKNKILIWGHSYGGYATYMSLLKYPDLFTAGVAVSAPSDIKEWMKTLKRKNRDFAYEFWETALGSKDSKYLKKISPITYAEDFSKPIMIFHGKRDRTVPAEQAETMAAALRKNKKNVRLEILKGQGHSFEDIDGLGYILDVSDVFFQKTMKKE